MWFRVLMIAIICAMVACSFGGRHIDGKLQDESFDFSSVGTIGFVPDYSDWLLRGAGSHHLEYDPVYSCFESTLGNIGYDLIPLPVAEWPDGGGIWGVDLPETYPDVIVLVTVETETRDVVVRDYGYHSSVEKMGIRHSNSGMLQGAQATLCSSTKVRPKKKQTVRESKPTSKAPSQTKPRSSGNETTKESKPTRGTTPPTKSRTSAKDDLITGGSSHKEIAPPSPPADPPICRLPSQHNSPEVIIIEPPVIIEPYPPIPIPPPPYYPGIVETHVSRVTITCSAWANPPHYNRLIWEGKVTDEPSAPLDFGQVQRLVRALIHGGHFPVTGDYHWIAKAEAGQI